MGTYYRVTMAGPIPRKVVGELRVAVMAKLERLNAALSTWLEDSEVSRFNRSAAGEWATMSEDFAKVVGEALAVHAASGGAFDCTVGPAVKLWGFGDPNTRIEPPPADAIVAAKSRIGSKKLELDAKRLRKTAAGVEADFSAIAKGYAVDEVAAMLERFGVTSYLVDIGGELRGRGGREPGGAWRVGIEAPRSGERGVYKNMVLAVDDASVATSGTYRNYFDAAGKRYSHTIDPRTGAPVTHDLVSATVVAPTCMTADAWVTAFMVLGPEAGYDVAVAGGMAVLFIRSTDDGFVERATPAMERLLRVSRERLGSE